MYRRRTQETFLKKASKQFPVLLLTGPRQVGKTTILQHLSSESRTYISLDDPGIALLARQEPALFLQRFKPPLLIDEIQYAPELLPFIKLYVDKHKKMGDFWDGISAISTHAWCFRVIGWQSGHRSFAWFVIKERLSGQIDATSDEPFLPLPHLLEKRLKHSKPLLLKEVYKRV